MYFDIAGEVVPSARLKSSVDECAITTVRFRTRTSGRYSGGGTFATMSRVSMPAADSVIAGSPVTGNVMRRIIRSDRAGGCAGRLPYRWSEAYTPGSRQQARPSHCQVWPAAPAVCPEGGFEIYPHRARDQSFPLDLPARARGAWPHAISVRLGYPSTQEFVAFLSGDLM